ncbi:hypothetical protein C1645_753979 [Glomus cerebriforme]|uniref:Uncharacterized protein n=1 Tax=Glomus cerebriforme TaxID=658196 RepID=A0A397TF77_9GLOM|nr:hypothetical protein C1645_753979 [Glomus cerebriforme]
MDYIICTTLSAFRKSWLDIDTSVWDILAGRIHELLLYPECHEPIFTNSQQKNITILTGRRMIHSVCLECPAIKAKEKNDVFQIKTLQDTKLSNHNASMVEQTQDITNLQDECSIEEGIFPRLSDIFSEKALLEDREMDAFLDEEYKKKVKLSTSSHPISNNPDLSEQNAKIKAPEIDIQPLIQELLIEPSKEDCVMIVNVEESLTID